MYGCLPEKEKIEALLSPICPLQFFSFRVGGCTQAIVFFEQQSTWLHLIDYISLIENSGSQPNIVKSEHECKFGN